MSDRLLPLFPLSVVLLPDTPLPLHIFEERYKQMMADIIPQHAEFGVVLAKDQGIVNMGCSAVVDEVLQKYDDGRMDLVAVGRRRFRILNLDEGKPYLRGEVEFFEDADDTPAPPQLKQNALRAYQALIKVDPDEAADENEHLSFQIANAIADLDKRQAVLSIRSEVERLRFLLAILPEYTVQRERTAEAKRLAPTNGHAKHIRL
jgi:Lon protease-like protein